MRRECRERFPRHRGFSDPDMHHSTCLTHVPWCMPGSLTSGFLCSRWRGKRSRHSGACATRNFTYLVRGPWDNWWCGTTVTSHQRHGVSNHRLLVSFINSVFRLSTESIKAPYHWPFTKGIYRWILVTSFSKTYTKYKTFLLGNALWNRRLQIGGHFVQRPLS